MSKLDEARKMLETLKTIEIGGRNNIKEGTVVALLNKFTQEKSRAFVPYFKADFTVVKPMGDGRGRQVGSEGYDGHMKGDTFSTCFFLGDRFQRDIGPFLCAVLDISKEDAATMTAAEIQQTAALLLDCEGEQVGAASGQALIEIKGIESKPVEDKKKPGTLRTYINERYVRTVKPSELGELEEKDIVRYFGSLEAFAALMEAEG